MEIFNVIEYKNAMEGIAELADDHAKAVRAYYNALIKQGFSKLEALRIVEKHGIMPPMNNQQSDE